MTPEEIAAIRARATEVDKGMPCAKHAYDNCGICAIEDRETLLAALAASEQRGKETEDKAEWLGKVVGGYRRIEVLLREKRQLEAKLQASERERELLQHNVTLLNEDHVAALARLEASEQRSRVALDILDRWEQRWSLAGPTIKELLAALRNALGVNHA